MSPLLLLIPVGLFFAFSGSSSRKRREPIPTEPGNGNGSTAIPQLPPGADVNKGVEINYGPFGDTRGVQAALIALGYDLGKAGADAKIGSKSTAAIRLFQAMAGQLFVLGPFDLRQDGKLDSTTVLYLSHAVNEAWPLPAEWVNGTTQSGGPSGASTVE